MVAGDIVYTNTGKKVNIVFIDDENAMCREVYVSTDGNQEKPHGESFVVKTDKLCKECPQFNETWLQKKKRKLEEELEHWNKVEREKLENEVDTIRYEIKNKREMYVAYKKAIDAVPEDMQDEFQHIVDVMTGKLHWVVKLGCSPFLGTLPDLLAYYETDYGRTVFDNLKLLTLFGDPNARAERLKSNDCNETSIFQWRLNKWCDGSGYYSNNDNIHFFETEEEAKGFLSAHISEQQISSNIIKLKHKYNLSVPTDADIMAWIDDRKRQALEKLDESTKKTLSKLDKELALIIRKDSE